MKKPPYTVIVMQRVIDSDLPPHLKLFLMVLAFLAKSSTGVAWYGQEAIAKAMSVSERQVRRYFEELELRGGPVRVERRRRGARDGKGRSSDEWRLILQPDTHGSSTGHPRPVDGDDQPDTHGSSTGHPRQLNRTPTSGDLRRIDGVNGEDPVSLRSTGPETPLLLFPADTAGTDPERTKASKRQPRSSKPKSGNGEAHKAVVAHYLEVFERKHGKAPAFDGADGTAVKRLLEKLKGDSAEACRRIDNAFGSWRGASVTIRDVASKPDAFVSAEAPRKANGRAPHVQRGLAEGVVINCE